MSRLLTSAPGRRYYSIVAILYVYPGTPPERTAKDLGVLPRNFSWAKRYDRRIIALPAAQGDRLGRRKNRET
jgi:hypothetical protein